MSCDVCETTPCDPHNHYMPEDWCVQSAPTPRAKKKEQQMLHAQNIEIKTAPAAPTDDAKEHLLRRFCQICNEKRSEAWDKYMTLDYPKTVGEAKEWFKNGKYKVEFSKDVTDDAEFDSYNHYFHWGTKDRDPEAYEKATDAIEDAKTEAIDTVTVFTDPDTRMKALKDFEAYEVQ